MHRPWWAVLLLSGCATAPVPSAVPTWTLLSATPDTEEIQIQGSQHLRRAKVTEAGARGPFLNVSRVPGKLQGTIGVDTPLSLRQNGTEVLGSVGSDAYDLTLMPDGEETRAQGQVAGLPTTFWMSPAKIRGSVGPCRFEFVWGSGRYTGGRNCGPQSDMVSVLLPAAMASWSDPEAAALLTLMLMPRSGG